MTVVSEADLSPTELAAKLGIVSAKPLTRCLAFTIDVALWLIAYSPSFVGVWLLASGRSNGWAIAGIVVGVAAASLFGVLQLLVHGRRGVTAGKAMLGLRSISVVTLERPGFWRIVLRALVLWVSMLVPVIGPTVLFASGLFDDRGRSWLDRLALCWLVDTRAGLDPADEKAMRRTKRALFAPKRDISEHLPSLTSASMDQSFGHLPNDPRGQQVGGVPRRSSAGIVGTSRDAWSGQRNNAGATSAGSPQPGGAAPVVLRFDDQTAVRVLGGGLIGRMPTPPEGRTDLALVTLSDPQRELSKTHLGFGLDDAGFWVEDLGSSNGTTVLSREGETPLQPHTRVHLGAGTTVRIGGRLFEVQHEGRAA